MGVFDSVSREQFEDMKAQRDDWREQARVLLERWTGTLEQAMALKRHDLGIMPTSQQANPVDALGPLTRGAIEEMGAGYPDLQAKLTNFAVAYTNEMRARHPDADVDEEVAARIREGDEA